MSVTLLLKIMSFDVNNLSVLTDDFTSTGAFHVFNPGVMDTEVIPTWDPGTIFYVKNYNGQGPKFIYFNNSREQV